MYINPKRGNHNRIVHRIERVEAKTRRFARLGPLEKRRCGTKRRYRTMSEARAWANKAQERLRVQFNAYSCDDCGWFHTGRERERINGMTVIKKV